MEQFLIAAGEQGANVLSLLSNPATQLLVLPLLGLIFICATPRDNLRLIRFWAVLFSGLTLLVAILMLTGASRLAGGESALRRVHPLPSRQPRNAASGSRKTSSGWQIKMGETQSFSAHYFVGIDGLSCRSCCFARRWFF